MPNSENVNQNYELTFVKAIFFEYTGKRWSQDASMKEIMFYMDELNILESVMDLENEFEIEITDDEWEDALKITNTLNDVIILIQEKLKEKQNEN